MSSTLFSCGVKRTLKVADIPGTTLLPASSGPTTRKYSESCSSSFTCRGTLAKKNITKTPWNKKTWGRYTCKWWFIHHYLCLVLIVVIILLQSSMTNHSALLKHNPGPMTHPNPQYVVNAFFFSAANFKAIQQMDSFHCSISQLFLVETPAQQPRCSWKCLFIHHSFTHRVIVEEV